MTIEQTKDGDTLIMKVSGQLNTLTAPQLTGALDEALEGAQRLILDFSDLQYISSAGLRILIQTQKIMSKRGGMSLRGVSEAVMEVLQVTGILSVMTIES